MTTALVLVDLQNDYFPGGTMELVGAEPAVGRAAELLQAFRRRSLPIFHVQHIATRPGATFFLPGTAGAAIHAAVAPAAGEPVVTKHFPNAFRETTLLQGLRGVEAKNVVFAGMMTHMCIDTSVRAAADLGFACSLAGDACATRDLQLDGTTVEAAHVQLAYLAGLNGAFAAVRSAAAIGAAL